jgi:hypothetical protein
LASGSQREGQDDQSDDSKSSNALDKEDCIIREKNTSLNGR